MVDDVITGDVVSTMHPSTGTRLAVVVFLLYVVVMLVLFGVVAVLSLLTSIE